MAAKHRFIKLQFFDDGVDGNLTIVESRKQVPFEIKRVYYINNLRNKAAVRGMHAHKKLEQAMFCLQGSFDLELDDGVKRYPIRMDKSHLGVYIPPGMWRVMRHFSPNCVIMVLASDYYKKSDYIREYAKFLKFLDKSR